MRTRRLIGQQGYTLIEVMVALTILVIGFIGLLNLQVRTIQGASDSLALTQAMTLSEHYLGSLQMEALNWTTAGQTDSVLLPRLSADGFMTAPVAGATSGWLSAWPDKQEEDARVGLLGDEVLVSGLDLDGGARLEITPALQRRFCVHYRLTWVQPAVAMRVEVRVAWSRDQSDFSSYLSCPADMVADRGAVSQFTLPGTLAIYTAWQGI